VTRSSSSSGGSATLVPTATGSGTNPGPTLVDGWFYVRGVAAPNYHSYLQAKPTGTAGDAYLDNASAAGQYNIVDGQLVYYTGAGGELYMQVENPADKTQRKLATSFSRTKNTYGTFVFQGDTVTWKTSDIQRPNEAAWLVCEGQHLFINTGAYGYQTPAGCADQTVRSCSESCDTQLMIYDRFTRTEAPRPIFSRARPVSMAGSAATLESRMRLSAWLKPREEP
jgi:hypothetical protein